MESHLIHLVVYSGLVATFFAVLARRGRRDQIKLGLILFAGMVGGALVLAYAMFPFPAPR